MHAPFFGELVFDPLVNCWEGRGSFSNAGLIRVALDSGDLTVEAFLPAARLAFEKLERTEPQHREDAAMKLLPIRNGYWRLDGEPLLDVPAFLSRMTLETIRIRVTGADLYYDDGDLFAGHTIYIDIDEEGRVFQASFEG